MGAYEDFAYVYDTFMDDTPYEEWCERIHRLIEKYGVSKVVYGHLHGRYGRTEIKCEKNGVSYYMTSCDKLGNRLIEIDGD